VRLEIHYTTRFHYSAPVRESQNELRACPVSDHRQQLSHYRVTTTPSARPISYLDYWGTRVDAFGVRAPHERLEVLAEATVETSASPTPEAAVPRSALLDEDFRDRHLEFLLPSPHVQWGEEVAAAARERADGADDGVMSMVDAVQTGAVALEYDPGATYVGVSVDEVFVRGGGVCQDFAHLAIAMYRSVGIPARYVSGYFFAASDATGQGPDGDEVHVETHAWVEVAVPSFGWHALDPTNRIPVGERHVVIGRGRDYDDVAPFRGVYSGSATHELAVAVRLRRLASAQQQQQQ
jgi:transglutaminase-like putative cysteine protease